jgi:hypothetical protein
MKISATLIWIGAATAGILLAGCNRDTSPGDQAPVGVTNELSAMQYYAANDEFVTNDEVTMADQAVEPSDYGTFGKIDASVTPLRWGRFVTSVQRNISITVQSGDSIATGEVQKTITGTLRIRARTEAGDTVTIDKPFTDHSTRWIIFRRLARDTREFWLNWVPVATSIVNGGTAEPNGLIRIVKLQMFLPSGDTLVITDPNNYFLRYRWLRLWMGGKKDTPELTSGTTVSMRVTVVSASSDTDFVVLRYGFDGTHARRARMALRSQTDNGDGTYTAEYELAWQVHFHRGFFNAGVAAMTRATLEDDQAPYSVSWWGVPYRVF